MDILNIVTLSLSGLLLTYVGISRLFSPIKTYGKSSGIKLENDANLLNEIRGVSALMLLGGITILLGAVFIQLTLTSFIIAIIIFLGFAVGRVISTQLDGQPNKQLVQGLMFELVLGGLSVFCLVNLLV